MKHINKPLGERKFEAGSTVYEAHGTSDSVVLVKGIEEQPIDAWTELVNSGYKPTTCPHCGTDVRKNPGLLMVGAHVLDYNYAKELTPGKQCYIIPLCNRCNTSTFPKGISLQRDVNALLVEF